jgi:hypothetical protein
MASILLIKGSKMVLNINLIRRLVLSLEGFMWGREHIRGDGIRPC